MRPHPDLYTQELRDLTRKTFGRIIEGLVHRFELSKDPRHLFSCRQVFPHLPHGFGVEFAHGVPLVVVGDAHLLSALDTIYMRHGQLVDPADSLQCIAGKTEIEVTLPEPLLPRAVAVMQLRMVEALVLGREWPSPVAGQIRAKNADALDVSCMASAFEDFKGVPERDVRPRRVRVEAVILVEKNTLRALEDNGPTRNDRFFVIRRNEMDLGFEFHELLDAQIDGAGVLQNVPFFGERTRALTGGKRAPLEMHLLKLLKFVDANVVEFGAERVVWEQVKNADDRAMAFFEQGEIVPHRLADAHATGTMPAATLIPGHLPNTVGRNVVWRRDESAIINEDALEAILDAKAFEMCTLGKGSDWIDEHVLRQIRLHPGHERPRAELRERVMPAVRQTNVVRRLCATVVTNNTFRAVTTA